MTHSKKQHIKNTEGQYYIFISCIPCIAGRFFKAEQLGKPSKREGRKNMLSQKKNPSRGFANEGKTCARLSSR